MVNHWLFFKRFQAIFPHSCLLCESPAPNSPLCQGCYDDLPWNPQACYRCALPIESGHLCTSCLNHAPLQQRTIAPLRYEFPADHLISGLKYHGRLAHAPLLGELLLTRVQQAKLRRPDVLLPVPLHRKRLRERGYNQALELSRPLARHWQIQPETQLIERQRHTFAQMRLSAAARTKNPKGAFVLNTKRLAQLGTPQHVMIVDDVMTTGATLKAIAALLQQAGIPQITLCAVARTP